MFDIFGERHGRVYLVGVRLDARGQTQLVECPHRLRIELRDRLRFQAHTAGRPVLLRISSTWSMKSNSISKTAVPYGIAEVVKPRGVTYEVTCHQWLTNGECARRTLPTICAHMCNVCLVGAQSSTRRLGHAMLSWCVVTVTPRRLFGGVVTTDSARLPDFSLRVARRSATRPQPLTVAWLTVG